MNQAKNLSTVTPSNHQLSISTSNKKLANLLELGSHAPIGASTDEFANKIADELLDPTKSEFYKPFLEVVGFI